jgi:hypothetical protein
MSDQLSKPTWPQRLWLAVVLAAAVAIFLIGIDWGLPTRDVDEFLFGDGPVWSGEQIAELQPVLLRHTDPMGADVDRNPIVERGRPVLLNPDDARRAEILKRFRLYTYQPDEMITLRALSVMEPAAWDFDPKLYQYGGYFIYPVGALCWLADAFGLAQHGELSFYFEHPEAFGRFYVIARLYVAAFGMLGVWLAYVLGRQLANRTAGILAAFTLAVLPVMVNMTHEAKPHLPGAVLILAAVWAASRYLERRTLALWLLTSLLCGLAFGMVLSAWAVFVLVPIMVILRPKPAPQQLAWIGAGLVLAAAVFLLGNPYLLINWIQNPRILASNLSNSTAMYQVGSFAAGAMNTLTLLEEGVGIVVLVLAVLALPALVRAGGPFALLVAPAVLGLLQMISIGAGKPGEYGRFAVYAAAALAICAGVGAERFLRRAWGVWWAQALFVVLLVILPVNGMRYLAGFWHDSTDHNSRMDAARWLAENLPTSNALSVALLAEPAPYAIPPMNVVDYEWYLLPSPDEQPSLAELPLPTWVVAAGDDWPAVRSRLHRLRLDARLLARFPESGRPTVISWANKPMFIVACESLPPATELASQAD